MPKYKFECVGCNIQFTRILKMGEHLTHACPECKDDVPRVWEGFSHQFGEPRTSPMGNTGVHKEDYPTADHAVGRDAAIQHEIYEERQKVKRKARAESGTHALIRMEGEDAIDYIPMNASQREARRKAGREAYSLLVEQAKQKQEANR